MTTAPATTPPTQPPENPLQPIAPNPKNRWFKPVLAVVGAVVAITGIGWIVRRQIKANEAKAALPPGSGTNLPDVVEDPWEELDALMDNAPRQQPVEADGDGDTAAGVPYVWRVYGAPEGMPVNYQAIAMIPDDDGAWSYWGTDPSTPHFVMAGSVDKAMDKILAWANEN